MLRRLLPLLLVLAPLSAAAQSPADSSLAGSWALRMDDTTIFRFDLTEDAKGGWHATWSRPGSFASDGDHFRHLSGPPAHVQSATGIVLPDDTVELSFNDPRPGAIPDIFDFRQIDPDAVRMTYVGTGLAPYTLERVAPGAPIGPWDVERTYGREAAPEAPAEPPKDSSTEAPPPADASTFRLPPGAPTGR